MAQPTTLTISSATRKITLDYQTSFEGNRQDTLAQLPLNTGHHNANGPTSFTQRSSKFRFSAGPLTIPHRMKLWNNEPDSAAKIQKTPQQTSVEQQNSDFNGYYERSEKFLDEQGFHMVQPSDEIKVRKYIKVLTAPERSLSQQSNSPLYDGSPMIKNVSGSSLLARRASRNNSVDSRNSSSDDQSPRSISSTNGGTMFQTPQKFSKFAEKSTADGMSNEEEEKVQICSQISTGENLQLSEDNESGIHVFCDFTKKPSAAYLSGNSLQHKIDGLR